MKNCKECPWVNNPKRSKMNERWMGCLKKLKTSGTIESVVHRCHMKSSRLFEIENGKLKTPDDNLCVGSVNHETDKRI